MLLPLSELKPSPWNPKEPFTKKQLAALKKGIETFGFQRSLCVCRDFISGEGYFTLDGNTALELLKELGKKKIDCHIVENVTDERTLQQFMASYSLNKKPIYSEFASKLGELDFSNFTGYDFGKFSFDVKIDRINPKIETRADNPVEVQKTDSKPKIQHEETKHEEKQTQYFLTLPPDCVDKLRQFVRTKAYMNNKTEAIAQKIDAMNDIQFLENVLQIVL